MTIWREKQLRILIDGKVLLKSSEATAAVSEGLEATKGAGYKSITRNIKEEYFGTSTRTTSRHLKRLEPYQESNPIFNNTAPLIPIEATAIQERHQLDLVSMARYPVKKGKKTYLYVLSVLDCFSRYLWIYPMKTKSSAEVTRWLKSLYESEGHRNILQSDQGSEFKKALTPFCKRLGILRITSSSYHPQRQGKVERSHLGWKRMFRYDMRTKTKFTDWVKSLSKYTSIYNRQHHSALGTSPFHVYHARRPNPTCKSGDSRPQAIDDHDITARINDADKIRGGGCFPSIQTGRKGNG